MQPIPKPGQLDRIVLLAGLVFIMGKSKSVGLESGVSKNNNIAIGESAGVSLSEPCKLVPNNPSVDNDFRTRMRNELKLFLRYF